MRLAFLIARGSRRAVRAIGRALLRHLPPLRRAYFWGKALSVVRGDTAFGTLLLAMSALLDTLAVSVTRAWSTSPKCYFDLRVRLLPWGVRFYVRRQTDDVYNIVPYGEADVHSAVLDPLEPGDVFVDVGANIGYYTVLGARRVGEQGKVIAVEMVPTTVVQLRRNVELNGCRNVEVVEAAVFSSSGLELTVDIPPGLFGQASVKQRKESSNLRVHTVTLDEVCRPYQRIKLIKVDIEGAELEALRGASETLGKTSCLVVECNNGVEGVAAYLRERGFYVKKLQFTTYILATRDLHRVQVR